MVPLAAPARTPHQQLGPRAGDDQQRALRQLAGQRLQAIERTIVGAIAGPRARSPAALPRRRVPARAPAPRSPGRPGAARGAPATPRAGSRGPRARSGCRAATTSRPRGDRRRRAGDARRSWTAAWLASAASRRPNRCRTSAATASNVSRPSHAGAATRQPPDARTQRPSISGSPLAPAPASAQLRPSHHARQRRLLPMPARPAHRHPLRHAEARGAFERRVELRQLRGARPRRRLDPARGARMATLSVMARFKQARAVRPETRLNETRSDGRARPAKGAGSPAKESLRDLRSL